MGGDCVKTCHCVLVPSQTPLSSLSLASVYNQLCGAGIRGIWPEKTVKGMKGMGVLE